MPGSEKVKAGLGNGQRRAKDGGSSKSRTGGPMAGAVQLAWARKSKQVAVSSQSCCICRCPLRGLCGYRADALRQRPRPRCGMHAVAAAHTAPVSSGCAVTCGVAVEWCEALCSGQPITGCDSRRTGL